MTDQQPQPEPQFPWSPSQPQAGSPVEPQAQPASGAPLQVQPETGWPAPPPRIMPPPAPAGYVPVVPLPAPTKRRPIRLWIAGGVAALVALCCGIGALGSAFDDPGGTAGAAASSRPASPAATTTTSTATPTTAPPPTAPATTVPATTAPPPAPKPDPTYQKLTARDWKLIAKNPDAYKGKTYVVYGVVTQFDAATGDDAFRADVDGVRHASRYDYETNTLLSGATSQLSNLVADDMFRAQVTVIGSFSYDTQIGGSTTVPLLKVDSIQVL